MRATFLVAFAALLAVSAAQAQSLVSIRSSVSVDDANIRAVLKDNATVVSIPIENTNDHAVRADLSLAWLRPDETTGDSARQTVSIPIGKTSLQVPFPIETSSIWSRLRYTLTPVTADARAFAPIRGILSLPHIADYVFEVKIGHVGVMHLGDPISVFAEAVHPLTRVPATGVEWTGTLEVGNRKLSPKNMIRHGGGIVEFVFDAPTFDKASGEDPDDSVKATISAKLGDFEVSTDDSIQLQTRWSARLQSDKPIYQPGQTLHLRAVVLDPQGRAIPAAKVSLHISTEDRERLHTAQLVASKFGVVQDEWTIPDNTDLGALQIELVSQDNDDSRIARHVVRLSRYELPTFSVTATPDRPAYLPTQQPHVTIAGMYLFGKPVPNGHVKIVRSADTYGGFRGSKANSNEKVVAEGDADAKDIF